MSGETVDGKHSVRIGRWGLLNLSLISNSLDKQLGGGRSPIGFVISGKLKRLDNQNGSHTLMEFLPSYIAGEIREKLQWSQD